MRNQIALMRAMFTGAAALGLLSVPAHAAPCGIQGILVPGPGVATSGRIELCSEITRQVPELQAAVDKMSKMLAASEDRANERARELQRLLVNMSAASAKVDAKRSTLLAQSLAAELSKTSAKQGPAAMREVRNLSDKVEEIVERIDAASKDARKTEAVRSGLSGPIGDAVAKLDFDQANKLMDGISALQKQLGTVEKKVDVLTSSVQEGNHVTVLAEASRSKPAGDMGQVAALGALAGQKKTFDGYDFSGMGLMDLQAPSLVAAGADFSLARMTNARLAGANLEGARLLAARLDASDLGNANLKSARAALVIAQRTVFRGADLSLSSWAGADLRGADLQSVNLRGASLEHADLRGADLRGADLSGAFLGNADLREAKWDGAKFGNTDVSHALLARSDLSAAQRAGLCATAPDRTQIWSVVEQIPSSKFSGGYEYAKIFDGRLNLGEGGGRSEPRCAQRAGNALTEWNRPVYGNDPERWSDDFGFRVVHALVNASGRRGDLLRRVKSALDAAQGRSEVLRSMAQPRR